MVIEELSVLKTGLGTAAETRINAGKNTCETMTIKISPKISLSSHSHFIEHLADVFKKSPHENN
jgi:hypothetical protein